PCAPRGACRSWSGCASSGHASAPPTIEATSSLPHVVLAFAGTTAEEPTPDRGFLSAFATPLPHCLTLNKSLNGLHNPVTLHVVCQYMLLRSVYWRPGALLERTCLARQLAGV